MRSVTGGLLSAACAGIRQAPRKSAQTKRAMAVRVGLVTIDQLSVNVSPRTLTECAVRSQAYFLVGVGYCKVRRGTAASPRDGPALLNCRLGRQFTQALPRWHPSVAKPAASRFHVNRNASISSGLSHLA